MEVEPTLSRIGRSVTRLEFSLSAFECAMGRVGLDKPEESAVAVTFLALWLGTVVYGFLSATPTLMQYEKWAQTTRDGFFGDLALQATIRVFLGAAILLLQ